MLKQLPKGLLNIHLTKYHPLNLHRILLGLHEWNQAGFAARTKSLLSLPEKLISTAFNLNSLLVAFFLVSYF